MIEILGGELEKAFEDLNVIATKTYQQTNGLPYQEVHQVWEMDESEFDKIKDVQDDEWDDDWGWWRYAKGSNMTEPITSFKINGNAVLAWYNENKLNEYVEDFLEDGENEEELIGEYFEKELTYTSLLNYFCNEHGVSQPINICALAIDLAKINNMKMSELFAKYQG